VSGPVLDLLGVGFGPANLALAIALEEHRQRHPAHALEALFLERQPAFGWHRGMLPDGATLQVSFLKDLATTRDPRSDYTFLRYLQDVGRLYDFINHKTLYPSRVEFHAYLEWAADRLRHAVEYGHRVVAVHPRHDGGPVHELEVTAVTATGARARLRARNVVLAQGLRPHWPDGMSASERVWHSDDLVPRTAELAGAAARRVVVVGAGQSAAEATEHLHRSLPDAEVWSVFHRYGYSQSDDNPFANQVFDPAAVDAYHRAPPAVQEAFFRYHSNTNYAVVDLDLIHNLYRQHYDEQVHGRRRLFFRRMTTVTDLEEGPAGVRLTLLNTVTGERETVPADAVVFATGYRPADPWPLLEPLRPFCRTDSRGRPLVGRDHRLQTGDGLTSGVYLLGAAAEHSHGLASGLLSLAAPRAGEVLTSLLSATGPAGPERADLRVNGRNHG
jgi:L-ornithine N5-oxygenase